MKILLAVFLIVNALFVALFTPVTWRFLRDQYPNRFPFSWASRLRNYTRRKRDDLTGTLLVIAIIFCYWLFSFAL